MVDRKKTASARQRPVERTAEAGLDAELQQPHLAPHPPAPDAQERAVEKPLGLVLPAVAAEQVGEIERHLDLPRLQLEHLAQQQHRQPALPLLAQLPPPVV